MNNLPDEPIVRAGLLCDYALNSQDGKLSLVRIFNDIPFPSFPSAYPRFFVVFVLTLSQGSHTVEIGLYDPNDEPMLPDVQPAQIDVEVPGTESNIVMDLNNLVFPRAGIYEVRLTVDDQVVDTIPLRIHWLSDGTMTPGRA